MRDGHMAQCEPCIQIKKKKKRIKRKKNRKVKRKRKEETDSVREMREKKNFIERNSNFSLIFTKIGP